MLGGSSRDRIARKIIKAKVTKNILDNWETLHWPYLFEAAEGLKAIKCHIFSKLIIWVSEKLKNFENCYSIYQSVCT